MSAVADLKNTIQLVLRSGSTGEALATHEVHNDISDDLLATDGYIYLCPWRDQVFPYCFLLKDGPDWATFAWDRRNPWAPYCATLNNRYGAGYDIGADPHWAPKAWSMVGGRHRLFYQWTKLADDLVVKAIGLTAWDPTSNPNHPVSCGIIVNQASVFLPQSLVVLPTPILVRGRKGGTQVPDILEVSYFMSVVGVN